jgi:solute carrier family 25 (mitochondrial folate transporter), member 32
LIFSSISAKIVAASITYPHEVIRARMMDGRIPIHNSGTTTSAIPTNTSTNSLWKTLLHIVRYEGIKALWTGLRVNLIRIVPSTTATFLSYEYLSRSMNQLYIERYR